MPATPPPTLLVFSRDLRLEDHPALLAALARGAPVIPVFLFDPDEGGPWAMGAASRWWLHGSLAALAARLAGAGSDLVLRRGPAEESLDELVAQTGAAAVAWTRRVEPWAQAASDARCARLARQGIDALPLAPDTLAEPGSMRTQKGDPFRVFTPFWNALRERAPFPAPLPSPERVPAPAAWPASDRLEDWNLRPAKPDWAGGLRAAWTPGEAAARQKLDGFPGQPARDYAKRRDFPGVEGTSRLSAHLHFGEIGPRQVWHALSRRGRGAGASDGVATFLSQIAWREFSVHLLNAFPALPDRPLRAEFEAFSWESDEPALRAWQQGRTGYPIVDAGMRELWATGWMHNRVRMVVASFLVKDLLLDWRHGERWFWDTLVDADLANNAANWQWVAGCGADAAPFFRIFNPVLQGEKFDPDGGYVRRWVPELARLPDELLHAPWQAGPIELAAAGIELGRDYPRPIVEHGFARHRALRALQEIKGGG
jgi:deoxyribodipyrimidine photo-lyase